VHSSIGGARGSPASLQHLEVRDEVIEGMSTLLSSMQHKCHRHLLEVKKREYRRVHSQNYQKSEERKRERAKSIKKTLQR
jgi:hypothetical protein